MTEAEADQKIEAEMDKVWPEWRGRPGSVGQVGIRLEQRGDVFDYYLVNVGRRLPFVRQAIEKALGDHTGICLSSS